MFIVGATAASTAAFTIRTPNCQVLSEAEIGRKAKFSERYMRWVSTTRRQLSSTKAEVLIEGPTRLPAQWLATVQDRIQRSILPRDQQNDGRWLSDEIAESGATFFETTSDLLPSEPYIYASTKGDLVAEFKSDRGIMTSIITQDCIALFAMVDGIPVEKTLPLASPESTTRQQLQGFTETLLTKQHGAVGSRS